MDNIFGVYDPEKFRKEGYQLVDLLTDWLKDSGNSAYNNKVIDWHQPDDELQFWKDLDYTDPIELFKSITTRSIRIHHPQYMGHQVCAPAPLASLAAFHGALLNNGGAVFEMGQASCALEKYLMDFFKPWFGYNDDGDGFFTSGGTLANITALLSARAVKADTDIWTEGTHEQFAVMVSEEAHYCIDRAVRIMGWGSEGIIPVPVDKNFRMQTDLLEGKLEEAINNGKTVIAVVGSAPSTATGIYDSLSEIGKFCQTKKLWFHIDAAHGGPAVFSDKYKYLMDGSGLADSITVDAHKMMMIPGLTTMLFYKNYQHSYQTFAQKAHYLWGNDDQEWYNYGKRTMECTKLMMSTRVYMMLKTNGVGIFGEFIDRCYDLAQEFYSLLINHSNIQVAVKPQSNIVCFRFLSGNDAWDNQVNTNIRQTLLETGDFYIVQTKLYDRIFLRTTLISPNTKIEHLEKLLENVIRIGRQISTKPNL